MGFYFGGGGLRDPPPKRLNKWEPPKSTQQQVSMEGGGSCPRGGGGRGVDWIGLDWCFALFGRAIRGSQVARPTGPVTLTCERPLNARGPKVGVP